MPLPELSFRDGASAGTTVSNCDATTGWDSPSQLGNIMTLSAGTDFVKEGSGALAFEAKTVKVVGARYDLGAGGIDFTVTGRRLYGWVIITAASILDLQANGGVRVYVEDTSGNYGWFYIGGSDVQWCYEGWKRVCININQNVDLHSGTEPTKSAIRYVGFAIDNTSTLGKADAFAIDIVHYGTHLEVYGYTSYPVTHTSLNFNATNDTITRPSGSWITDGIEVGDVFNINNSENTKENDKDGLVVASLSATVITLSAGDINVTNTLDTSAQLDFEIGFDDIIREDDTTNDTQLGFVTKNKGGVFELLSHIKLGDETGAFNTWFRSAGDVCAWADNNLSAGDNKLEAVEDTGDTHILFGYSSGTGEDKVGFGGSTFYTAEDVYTYGYTIDFSATVFGCQIYGSIFRDADDGITLSAAASRNDFISNSVINSGQVLTDNAVVRECFFNSTSDASAAYLWQTNSDIQRSKFLANIGTNVAGIEYDVAGTFSAIDIEFAGNTYDIVNTDEAVSQSTYASSNQDTNQNLGDTTTSEVGESFAGLGVYPITRARWWLKIGAGTPSGTMQCEIFAVTGSLPTETPTGSVLSTSETVNASVLTGSYAYVDFEFTDDIDMAAATRYMVKLTTTVSSATDYIHVGTDTSSPGNITGNFWTDNGGAQSGEDAIIDINGNAFVDILATGTSNPSTDVNTATVKGSTLITASKSLTITGLLANTEVRILDSNKNELDGIENSGTSFIYSYSYVPATTITIMLVHIDYLVQRFDYLLTASDAIIPIQYTTDRVYSNP